MAFLKTYAEVSGINKKLMQTTVTQHLDKLKAAEAAEEVDQWTEQVMQLLYWGETNDTHLIEEEAIQSFKNILDHSKIERRATNYVWFIQLIVERGIGHPGIIKALEDQLMFKTIHD